MLSREEHTSINNMSKICPNMQDKNLIRKFFSILIVTPGSVCCSACLSPKNKKQMNEHFSGETAQNCTNLRLWLSAWWCDSDGSRWQTSARPCWGLHMYEDQHKSSEASVALERRRFTEISREIKRERTNRGEKSFQVSYINLGWRSRRPPVLALCESFFGCRNKDLMSKTFLFILKT